MRLLGTWFLVLFCGGAVFAQVLETTAGGRIAMVADTPGEGYVTLFKGIAEDVTDALGGEPEFVRDAAFLGDGTVAGCSRALTDALKRDDIDVVLCLGGLTTRAAAGMMLDKPVIAGFLHDAGVIGLDFDSLGRSGKKNLSFVAMRDRISRDLSHFQGMLGFSQVHILIDEHLLLGDLGAAAYLGRIGGILGLEVKTVPFGKTGPEPAAVLDGAAAVYIALSQATAQKQVNRIIDIAAKHKVPSFSMLGGRDVEQGTLGGMVADLIPMFTRRVAANLAAVLKGAEPESLAAYLPMREGLIVNGRTAARIGFDVDPGLLMTATVLHPEALERGEILSMAQAVSFALERNTGLAARRDALKASAVDVDLARSRYLPQVGLRGDYQQLNSDQTSVALGIFPETQSLIAAEATQVIYDESVFSNARIARHAYLGQEHLERGDRLDVALQAGNLFLEYRKARALLKIEIENTKLTRSNLDTARVRYELGAAGKEEVYRWEAQESNRRAALLTALANVERLRVSLNQVLGFEPDTPWRVQAGDEAVDTRWRRVLEAPRALRHERVRMLAVTNAPSLKALDEEIKGRDILVGQKKRSLYLPQVQARFSMERLLDQSFLEQESSLPFPGLMVDPPDVNWTFSISASLPLYLGGARYHELGQAKARSSESNHKRIFEQMRVEEQALSALYALEGSYPAIELNRKAAVSAHRNLDLVQERYALGEAAILEVLDAQNQALASDQQAAITVFSYQQDLLALQRALAWFSVTADDAAKEAFFEAFHKEERPPEP